MPAASEKLLCDALVAHLAGGTYSQTVSVEWAPVRPVQFGSITTALVVLVPVVKTEIARSSARIVEGHRVELHVLKTLTGQTADLVAPLLQLFQELANRARTYVAGDESLRVTDAAAAPRPPFNSEALTTGNHFHGVGALDCEVNR